MGALVSSEHAQLQIQEALDAFVRAQRHQGPLEFVVVRALNSPRPPSTTRSMVLEVGLEPTRCLQRRILNPVRLPIPPLQHKLSSEHPVTHLTLTLQAFRDWCLLFF